MTDIPTEIPTEIPNTIPKPRRADYTPRQQVFNVLMFIAVLDSLRASRALTWREVAAQAGVSASLFSRMEAGAKPSADSLVLLLHWAGLHDVRRFCTLTHPGR